MLRRGFGVWVAVSVAVLYYSSAAPAPEAFRFVILGDRTGSAQPGVYERVWQEAAAYVPAFFLSVGDSIEGRSDATAEGQWQLLEKIWKQHTRVPLYLTPGNHDVWSAASEGLFRKYSGHPVHYSFDQGPAHFTILDNSRTEEISEGELAFLEADLREHRGQPLKFILTHRPSWLVDAAMRNPASRLHRLAKQYGVRFVLAGHVHQMLHVEWEGVTYLSVPSSGGALRLSKEYREGWFFGYLLVDVRGQEATVQVKELKAPFGQGRVTGLRDWGLTGLVVRAARTDFNRTKPIPRGFRGMNRGIDIPAEAGRPVAEKAGNQIDGASGLRRWRPQ